MTGPEQPERIPVVIAGGGVVGVATALFLARQGVRSLILEANPAPSQLPRAHALNPRSIETFAEIGIDYQSLLERAAPKVLTSDVRFVTTLTGHCFGTIPYERQDDAVLHLTPTPIINIAQPALEALLFERAAGNPLVEVRRGHSWKSEEQDLDGVRSTVGTAGGEEYVVASSFLIGADGAGSKVRDWLGVGLSGVEQVAASVSISFRADLTAVLEEHPGVIHWVFGAEQRGSLLTYDPARLWSFIMTGQARWVDVSEYTPQRCLELVRAALGPGAAETPIDVLGVTPWTMRCQVADSYQVGRVFLAGDSAHRFPPTGGLGLNTGLQDAHNLAWKVAGVLAGWAGPGLLASYDDERRQVATRNAEQSLANVKEMAALELLEGAPRESDPEAFAAWLAAPGRAELIADVIDRQRPHFDSLALQLGFAYTTGDADVAAVADVADVATFDPRAVEGGRLPHGWVTVDGERISTLALLDPCAFTLLLLDDVPVPPSVHGAAAPLTVVELHAVTGQDQWRAAVGLSDRCAVLVRPDGHILRLIREPSGLGTVAPTVTDFVSRGGSAPPSPSAAVPAVRQLSHQVAS